MFNDGGKGSGTSEDLAIEERMRIATEGIIVVDLEVFDNPPADAASASASAPDADGERPPGPRGGGGGYMTARRARHLAVHVDGRGSNARQDSRRLGEIRRGARVGRQAQRR